MKFLRKLVSVLMIIFVMVAFAPLIFDSGEVYAASIKLNKKTVYLLKGKTCSLKVKGTNKKVKWKSSDSKVVKVSKKGKLTAKGYGTAVITAKVSGKKLKCKVTVERSTERKARKLRDYIIKHGSKKGSDYTIQKTEVGDAETEGLTRTYRITASEKNKVLVFSMDIKSYEPPATRNITLTIDLISGKSALKTGTAYYHFVDEYSLDAWEDYYAEVNTGFSYTYADEVGTAQGIKVTGYYNTYEEVEKQITDPAELAKSTYRNPISNNLNGAFKYWDKLISSKKALKKDKICMKTIGFSKIR